MLDPTMSYSSAYFADPAMTLEQASVAKLELICDKLDLGPGDHVVEIGTGWGGFAVHAARDPRLPRHHHDDLRRAAALRPRARPRRRRRAPRRGHRPATTGCWTGSTTSSSPSR